MELRHLRYFVRAAELLHFTRAANTLGVSQPTLSLHIQQLEREVGSKLFDRTGGQFRHVRLTQAGERFLSYAHEALRAVERGKEEIAALNGLLCGTVTLGLNNIFVGRVMEHCIPAFASAYSGVDLMLRMGSQDELEAAILDGAMDLALTWLPAESREIEVTILFDDELIVVSGENHPLGQLPAVTLQQVEPFPLALPGRVGNIRRLFDAACAKQKISPRVSLGIDDTAARLSFVEAGYAATVAPRSAVANRPRLRISRILNADVKLSAGLLTNKGAQLASGARRLFDELQVSFSEPDPARELS